MFGFLKFQTYEKGKSLKDLQIRVTTRSLRHREVNVIVRTLSIVIGALFFFYFKTDFVDKQMRVT